MRDGVDPQLILGWSLSGWSERSLHLYRKRFIGLVVILILTRAGVVHVYPGVRGCIQVVPFVADSGQAKIRFAGIRLPAT